MRVWHILQRLISPFLASHMPIWQRLVTICILISSLASFSACHRHVATNQHVPDRTALEVTVQDATTISGCRFVLHPASGPDLLPVSCENEEVDFYPEGVYQITYRPDSSSVFACTADAVPVHILSCHPVRTGPPPGTGGIKPPRRPCAQTIDPYSIPWMTQLMQQLDPDKVTRVQLSSGLTAYGFHSRKGFYLFDCQGSCVCMDKPGEENCKTRPDLNEPQVILVRNY
ncbi:MAG: hypothetical protein IPJ06_05085 [Saprospiraceae bacterium]|nr:hypothetical protein [Saprospiraceae bacterium]